MMNSQQTYVIENTSLPGFVQVLKETSERISNQTSFVKEGDFTRCKLNCGDRQLEMFQANWHFFLSEKENNDNTMLRMWNSLLHKR